MCALNDKVVIVTGGSSGIGRAAALSFAKQGAKVIITARRTAPLEEAAADHPNISGLVADVAASDDAGRTIAKAVDTWGRLDVLVNNAGAGAILPLADATADRIMKIFAVNVLGPSLLAAAALPYLAVAKGTIINVSSTFGHKPVAGLSHYASSKAALEHLTRCWALELAPHGVRVSAIAAGPTESGALTGMMGLSPEQAAAIKEQERERIPLKRRGNPGEVARWIVSLADPASEWMTGQVIAVDGGLGSHNRIACAGPAISCPSPSAHITSKHEAVSAIEPVMLLAWFIVETNDDSCSWFARRIFHARSNGNSIYSGRL